MEELDIKQDELNAHDALNDSIFTGYICKAIALDQGIAQYEQISKNTYSQAYFPEPISFFIMKTSVINAKCCTIIKCVALIVRNVSPC